MKKVRASYFPPRIAFVASLPAIVLLFLLNTRARSQDRDTQKSSASAAVGFTWYSPPDGTRFKEQPEKFNSYSGMAVAIRIMFATPGIWSRLSLGAEYGIHALAGEKSTFVFIVDTGHPTIKDIDVYYFQLVGNIELLKTSFIKLHTMVGSGIVSDDESQVLRGGWIGKVIGVFPLFWDDAANVGMSLDIELASINSYSGMRLGTVGVLAGVSYRW